MNKPPVSSLLLPAILWAAVKLAGIMSNSCYCCCLQKPLTAAGIGHAAVHTEELALKNTKGGTDKTTAIDFPTYAQIHRSQGSIFSAVFKRI